MLAALLLLFAPAEDAVTIKSYRWAPFISPMGEPFVARAVGEDTLATWFGVAPTDLPTIFPKLSRFAAPNLGFLG